MTTAIQVNDLHYTYEGQDGGETHIVFDDLSLSIEQGSFVAVLGHNGCGKSTLAKHFNAILLPAGGSVTVYGMDTKDEEMLPSGSTSAWSSRTRTTRSSPMS